MYLWTFTCLPTWCICATSLSKNGNKVVCEVFLPEMGNFCSHLRAVHPAPCSPMQPFGMVLADSELPPRHILSQFKFLIWNTCPEQTMETRLLKIEWIDLTQFLIRKVAVNKWQWVGAMRHCPFGLGKLLIHHKMWHEIKSWVIS